MAPRLISVRQPRRQDLIGKDFVIAGYATGFEATVSWRILDPQGDLLGSGNLTGVGSMGQIRDFGNTVSLGNTSARGAHVTLQVFGEDASGIHPPGTDLNVVHVTLFATLQAFRLYEVESGDSLTAIAQEHGENTTADDIFEANRDRVINPDLIYPGQVLRIPLLS